MRVAAIDCGTNTIKLMIAELPSGEVLVRETRMVRLGQDLDRTGRLADEALERAFAAVDDYAALIAEHPVDRLRFCATSASRDASNAAVFVAGVEERLGVRPEVVAGHEEARLAYDGAVRNLRVPASAPVLVVDIGGGSTELILGGAPRPGRSSSGGDARASLDSVASGPDADARSLARASLDSVASGPDADARSLARASLDSVASMDIGSVRLHERHLHSDPPTHAEIASCVDDIDTQLDACSVDPSLAATVVGVAGTILTVTAGVLDLPTYDREAIDQAVISCADVHAFTAELLAMTVQERLALPYMHPGRADVIGAGALILDRVLHRAGAETLVASESDILDGIVWSMTEPSEGRASD